MISKKVSRIVMSGLLAALYATIADAQQAPAGKEISTGEVATAPSASIPEEPAKLASKPPRVNCGQGNGLSITAESSTLSSILAAVQGCTGVPIVVPQAAADERFYLQLGPGPAIEVVGALLASTDMDYVILPVDTAPGKIAKVVLLARSKSAGDAKSTVAENQGMTPARRAWMAIRNTGRRPAGGDEASAGGSEEEPAPPADPSASGEATASAAPQASPGGEPESSQPSATSNATTPVVTAPGAAEAGAKGSLQESGVSGASQQPAPGTAPTAPSDAAAADASKPKDELENKITDMQKMFEQRKKLGGDASPDQN